MKKDKRERINTGIIGGELRFFTLKNCNGMKVTVIDYGATIAKIEVPDREGQIQNVVLGHNDLANYIGGGFYFGATTGRYANRIVGGRFKINRKEYSVTKNRDGNLLHVGRGRLDKRFWRTSLLLDDRYPVVKLTFFSPDCDEGFPGNVQVETYYSLTDENELKIEYKTVSDETTVINLTNHSYFNLTGDPSNSILDHVLKINANGFIPIDRSFIPTGRIAYVANTPMDFRVPHRIGDQIIQQFEQIDFVNGYDHNWVLNNFNGNVREAATLFEPLSGRMMEVITDQPGLQFYSGNKLGGTIKGKEEMCYKQYSGLCLECQHFPNSPNEKSFPSVILNPENIHKQTTIYKFSVN